MFDQFKMMSEMMKGMDPGQLKELMKQAEGSKKAIEDVVRSVVKEEIQKQELVSKKDLENFLKS